MGFDMKQLIGRLNKPCRQALEEAAQTCVAQTHFNVELEHFLVRLLAKPDNEIHRVLRYYDIDSAKIEGELGEAMSKMKRGNSRTPALSPQILEAIEEAWLVSSLQIGAGQVRSGTILAGLLERDSLRGTVIDSCPSLLKLPRERLKSDLKELLKNSPEDEKAVPAQPGAAGVPGAPMGQPSGDSALQQYTVDLTQNAREGRIDPIQGRDTEIRQLVDILMRRRQNNPILTGEAGVGKTAVAEGLALRVAAGDVPPPLRNVAIRTLDLGLLQAGAGLKGEFENRLKSVISEVGASPTPIILFIDEAHTLIGAGGQAGQGDAANLLKPALARGELRTIAATTWAEYKKYFEKDPALARRFQVVKVNEPDEPTAETMVRGLLPKLEAHHKVRILDEAVAAAVRLTHRYIVGRQLPDKAISVLDTAAARVAVGQNATPAALEAAVRRVQLATEEIALLERERQAGEDHLARLERLKADLAEAEAEQSRLEERWSRETKLAGELIECLKGDRPDLDRLKRLKQELAAIQGEEPMVPVCVDQAAIAAIVSGWTGIPLGKMLQDDIGAVLKLEARMAERLIGQPQALTAIAQRIRTYRAGMGEPGKPTGVFLLAGPSGVGKTETAITLADLIYGGERAMVTINMSEFQEAHTVALLKGSPPGYVGYGQGGILTEAVRRQPYSVVLLDEIEKAHPDVLDLFYQVFDKGVLEDAEGVEVDFKNTLILLTTNLGTEEIIRACPPGAARPDEKALAEQLRPALLKRLKPAFLARLVVVPYYPLSDEILRSIVGLKLAKIARRMAEQHHAAMSFAPELEAAIAARCIEVDSGARNVDQILSGALLPELSDRILARMADGQTFGSVHVGIDGAGAFTYAFDDGATA